MKDKIRQLEDKVRFYEKIGYNQVVNKSWRREKMKSKKNEDSMITAGNIKKVEKTTQNLLTEQNPYNIITKCDVVRDA